MMERSRTNSSEQVSDALKLKYLALMCELKPDMVVLVLKSFIFPLEESLKICEKHKNLHGQAHIKSRTRNIDSAIRIYMEIMKQSIKQYLEANVESSSLSSNNRDIHMSRAMQVFLTDAMFAYQMIVEICKSEVEEMHSEGLAYFNLFMEYLFEMYADIERQDNLMRNHRVEVRERFEAVKNYIKTEILDDFMIIYITRVGTKGLIDIIQRKTGNTDQKLSDFRHLMLTLSHEQNMIRAITGSQSLQ